MGRIRERIWAAANVQLTESTPDTDTTVHTRFGNRTGARQSRNPKNKGMLSYEPILTPVAETKECVAGALRSGDGHGGKEIAAHRRRRAGRVLLLARRMGQSLPHPGIAV